jgi:hypothetical protein
MISLNAVVLLASLAASPVVHNITPPQKQVSHDQYTKAKANLMGLGFEVAEKLTKLVQEGCRASKDVPKGTDCSTFKFELQEALVADQDATTGILIYRQGNGGIIAYVAFYRDGQWILGSSLFY